MTEPDETAPMPRPAARVVLLDDADRLLLMCVEVPQDRRHIWITPGGGLLPTESHAQAARREVYEETGLAQLELGPWIWSREHTFRWADRLYRQQERYFLARVPAFEARAAQLEPEEADSFRALRWWTIDEMAATSEILAPRNLYPLVRDLLQHGPPASPLVIGA